MVPSHSKPWWCDWQYFSLTSYNYNPISAIFLCSTTAIPYPIRWFIPSTRLHEIIVQRRYCNPKQNTETRWTTMRWRNPQQYDEIRATTNVPVLNMASTNQNFSLWFSFCANYCTKSKLNPSFHENSLPLLRWLFGPLSDFLPFLWHHVISSINCNPCVLLLLYLVLLFWRFKPNWAQ